MPWMVIDLEPEQDEVHVVPSCWGGHMIHPHKLSYECVCNPDFEDDTDGSLLVLHRDLKGNADVP